MVLGRWVWSEPRNPPVYSRGYYMRGRDEEVVKAEDGSPTDLGVRM
jgi:hypothetical protein